MFRLPELPLHSPRPELLASHAHDLERMKRQWSKSSDSDDDRPAAQTARASPDSPAPVLTSKSIRHSAIGGKVDDFMKGVAAGASVRAPDAASEQVIRQLKQVVRAQHNKIEELRSTQDKPGNIVAQETSLQVQMHMQQEEKLNSARDEEECQRLTAQVRRLQNQVKELRSNNSDLKRMNRRYAGIISECGPGSVLGSLPASITPSSMELATVQVVPEQSGVLRPVASVPEGAELATPEPSGPPVSTDVFLLQQEPSPPPVLSKQSAGVPQTSKLAQVSRGCAGMWREMTPHGILTAMMTSAAEILKGGPPRILTLYALDPWLRKAMADHCEDISESWKQMTPTRFYLKGKVTVDAYQRDGGRVEPPRFQEIAVLPLRELSEAALPLQTGPGQTVFAALQVAVPSVTENVQAQRGPIVSVQPGSSRLKDDQVDQSDQTTKERPVLSDSQWSALQLLVSTAVGILDMRLQVEVEKTIQDRARDCLKITAEVSGTRSLPDFEQKVKLLLSRFFNVAAVRLCFYDHDSKTLVTSPSKPFRYGGNLPDEKEEDKKAELATAPVVGRRNVVSFSIQDGIIGRCVRKQHVCHLERLYSSVEVSERVDGVDISGRSGEINMLTGPMIAQLGEDRSLVVGTLQLIAKRRRLDATSNTSNGKLSQRGAGGKTLTRRGVEKAAEAESAIHRGPCDPFTHEDQDFFSSMLKILGLAAFRTMQAQARAEEGEIPLHVVRLFQAA